MLICAVVTCLMVIGRLVFKDLRGDIPGAPPLSERPYFLSYISLALELTYTHTSVELIYVVSEQMYNTAKQSCSSLYMESVPYCLLKILCRHVGSY